MSSLGATDPGDSYGGLFSWCDLWCGWLDYFIVLFEAVLLL